MVNNPVESSSSKAAAGRSLGEKLREFIAEPFGGDFSDMRSRGRNGFERGRFNDVAKARCEADGTRHAQAVFAETDVRVANGADNPLFEVLASADEVEYLLCLRDRASGR